MNIPKKITRWQPQQLKCAHCNQYDNRIFYVMKSHKLGECVKYEDYKLLKKEYDLLVKRTIIPLKKLSLKK